MNITYTFTCGNFDLFYIKLSSIFLEFRNWYAPKNAKKGEQNGLQTPVRFHTVLLRPLAEMTHVCLSLGRGHVFVRSQIMPVFVSFAAVIRVVTQRSPQLCLGGALRDEKK